MRLLLIVALCLLSACQMTLPGKGADAPTANPITGGAIAVTSLDAAPAPPPAPEAAPSPPAPAAEAELPAPSPPVASKSAAHLACEKDGGTWARVGASGAMTCVRTLRDSGKQCSRESECEGQCLARSGTCAPVSPMFGCNEVLQDNGQRVTLCID